MKNTLLTFPLLCLSLLAFGQKNVLKGRAFYFPADGFRLFSCGIGYERFVNQRISLQVQINRMGYDKSDYDGPAKSVTALAPELRYYFKDRAQMNQAWFVSLFVEFQQLKGNQNSNYIIDPGPPPFPSAFPIEEKPSPRAFAQGCLLGRTIRIGQRWHVEAYAGPRYISTHNQVLFYDGSMRTLPADRWGVRLGLSGAFRF